MSFRWDSRAWRSLRCLYLSLVPEMKSRSFLTWRLTNGVCWVIMYCSKWREVKRSVDEKIMDTWKIYLSITGISISGKTRFHHTAQHLLSLIHNHHNNNNNNYNYNNYNNNDNNNYDNNYDEDDEDTDDEDIGINEMRWGEGREGGGEVVFMLYSYLTEIVEPSLVKDGLTNGRWSITNFLDLKLMNVEWQSGKDFQDLFPLSWIEKQNQKDL